MRGADAAGVDQPGIAQHAEVVGHAGFRPSAVQFAAGGLGHVGQVADDFQAHRVAQGVEHAFECQVLQGGVFEGSREKS